MKRLILAATTLALLGASAMASAVSVTLTAHNSRSTSGTLSTQKWATCAPTGATNPCISTTNAWVLANVTGSTAVWDWDPVTGILSMTGTFQTTSHLSSNANGSSVISDKVTDMVINTVAGTTTAASYQCIEGTFLGSVGANGCLNVSLGDDFALNSSAAYNVGGNANCVNRTVGGDDSSTGNVRGLSSLAAGGGCDATDGAFLHYTVLSYTGPGGQLILSNGIPTGSPNTNYLTFSVVPVPAAVWLFGSAVGLLAAARRRTAKAA
ncbi:MAG: hypothetical protein ABIX37_01965 [Gammaproteobacteria bacterium]